jgi:hypothetical protein
MIPRCLLSAFRVAVREFHQGNYSLVPLVQRRKDLPFRGRQRVRAAPLEDQREVLPIYTSALNQTEVTGR